MIFSFAEIATLLNPPLNRHNNIGTAVARMDPNPRYNMQDI